jgi:hypothetical protein
MFDKDFDKSDLVDDQADEDMDDEDGGDEDSAGVTRLRTQVASTVVDLAQLGLTEIAYIRRATINNTPVWSIHSAAGHPLGAAESFEQAWAAVKQHDLEPVRVH